jgi:hypothetical protein
MGVHERDDHVDTFIGQPATLTQHRGGLADPGRDAEEHGRLPSGNHRRNHHAAAPIPAGTGIGVRTRRLTPAWTTGKFFTRIWPAAESCVVPPTLVATACVHE